ncbi:MAG: hypothetical protein LC128_12235 [Chitinophagales bacterium]|nr:hypothetical protein [Chitinophagales bacterium]
MSTQLPSLADLHKDPQEAFKNDQLKTLLNQPPSESWLKVHPLTKSKYLPIDKVEYLLDVIFQKWRVEVLQVQVILNAIQVTVRLHYYDPVAGEWASHDGVGAKSVQVDSGARPSDLSSIKDSAVMQAVPTAKSEAIKDAADHIGKLFGRDLNRKDTVEFAGKYSGGAAATTTAQADAFLNNL